MKDKDVIITAEGFLPVQESADDDAAALSMAG